MTVVAPTEHLKIQWADAAHRAGIRLDPRFSNRHSRESRPFHGVVVTYAQVAVRPPLHKRAHQSKRTLVILDEVHHGGDALSWGDAIRESFEGATRRLSLTGTPFRIGYRTDPVRQLPARRTRHPAVADRLRVRLRPRPRGRRRAAGDLPVATPGSMRWRTRQGEEMEAALGQGDTADVTAQAWRAALDPGGDWIPAVLAAADRRL